MLNNKKINNISIWGIIMSIFIIGLVSIFKIFYDENLLDFYNFNDSTDTLLENLDKINNAFYISEVYIIPFKEILDIIEPNILYIIFINIIFIFIFNSGYNLINKYSSLNYKNVFSMEYIFLISLGLLGLNFIILSNDLIYIFISLELYSLSVYLLILLKITKNTTRMSILYLLINSLSSYLFLLGIAILYKFTGSILLDDLYFILISKDINLSLFLGILFLILSILLKLGTVPFNFWVLRLYTSLESRILLYQILIPKLVYIFLLFKFFSFLILDSFNPFLNHFTLLLFLISFLSVIIGSIAGLFHTYFKSILTYSSILNMGFILLGFISNPYGGHSPSIWWEYILIYVINTLALFLGFFLINPNLSFFKPGYFNSNSFNNPSSFNYSFFFPFFSICILFSIFSFIGIPPFAGFYAKLNIFLNLFISYKNWSLLAIFFLLISTFISACFYLKFILYFFFKFNPLLFNPHILISDSPSSISYSFSFFSIFLILYPFLYNYLYPFYLLIQ